MDTTELTVRTADRLVTDLTPHVEDFCSGRGDGLMNVFVPHATAGLAVVETGSGTEHDLADLVDRVLPADDRYRHRHGSAGHGRDHVLPALVSPSRPSRSWEAGPRSAPGRASSWSTATWTTPSVPCA